jgi:hypothetical protein
MGEFYGAVLTWLRGNLAGFQTPVRCSRSQENVRAVEEKKRRGRRREVTACISQAGTGIKIKLPYSFGKEFSRL